jgi:hypothetical protein
MDDASLDDFLDTGDRETGDGGDAPTSSEDIESDATDPRATAVEPATATLQWSPEGGDCEACGTAVDRRWDSEAGLVCAECKDW